MPYKSEKIKIEGTALDRRRRLTEQQKDEIRKLKGTMSRCACAAMFGVSKRTIDFIWYPEKLARNKQCRKERGGWRQYYTKERKREEIKEYRHYKQDLYVEGIIKEEK